MGSQVVEMAKDLGNIWETFLWSINDEEWLQWPTYVVMKLPQSGKVLIEQTNTDTFENECAHAEREIVRRLRADLAEKKGLESCSVDMFYSTYTTCVDCVQWLTNFADDMSGCNCVITINVKVTNVTRPERYDMVRKSKTYWKNGSGSIEKASLLLQSFERSEDFLEVLKLMKNYAKAEGQQEDLEMSFPRIEYVVKECKHTREKIQSLLEDRPLQISEQARRKKAVCKDGNQPVSVDISECTINMLSVPRKLGAELSWRVDESAQENCDIYLLSEQIENFEPYFGECMVNKVPQLEAIRSKANLARALDSLLLLFPQNYNFYPKTWSLPAQYQQFCAEIACDKQTRKPSSQLSDYFIVKPDVADKGDGIYFINDPKDYVHEKNIVHVAQNYIHRPVLLYKTKFDFRLYLTLFSSNLSGIQMYLSSEGLSRFCTTPYEEPTAENIHDSFMHVTNITTNTYSDNFVHTDDLTTGTMRTVTSTIRLLTEQGYDTSELWSDIEQVVVKSMLAILPEMQLAFDNALKPGNNLTCFRIMGVDIILVDEGKLTPILIEINETADIDEFLNKQFQPGSFRWQYDATRIYVSYNIVKETLLIAVDKFIKGYRDVREGDGKNEDSTPTTPPFLCELFPGDQMKSFEKYRIFERLAKLYQASLAADDTHMSADCFRLFVRKCCFADFSLDTAVTDDLYTEHLQKDKGGQAEEKPGLSFPSFREAFIAIATKCRLPPTSDIQENGELPLTSPNTYERVESLLSHCRKKLSTCSSTA